MTTGTKVFLAFFAVIVGFLVLYYGVWSPGDTPVTVAKQSTEAQTESKPVDANATGQAATSQEVRARPAGEMATDPLATPQDLGQPQSPASSQSNPDSGNAGSLTQDGTVHSTTAGGAGAEPSPLDARDFSPPTLVGLTPPAGDSGVKANQPVSIGSPQPSLNHAPPKNPSRTPTAAKPTAAVPVIQNPLPSKASPPQTSEYVIKEGDTFMSVATDWFGDQTKWSMIAKANPMVDPTPLKIGQKIKLPSKDAKPEPIKEQVAAAVDSSQYIVRSGDTLAKIARELYSDVAKWQAIYDSNKSVIGSDPANLKPGMKLTLPANLKKAS